MPELQSVVQQYAWGKYGRESAVAQLQDAADPTFSVDDKAKYAELWMGTHPNGPARVLREGKPAELLSTWLQAHPEQAADAASGDLPFLFKVLSVQNALSIQAHPDITLAKELHAKFPDVYKDANHKPEIAIALTRFEALCQFRVMSEIQHYLRTVPELAALVDPKIVAQVLEMQDETALRTFFSAFTYTESDQIATQIARLRLRLEQQKEPLSEVESLVLRLNDEYQVDIGCFCPFLLNYITLQPGEAVFLGANEPHAYLSGDCIECMACSDNVVRAGLTPKFIDKATLCRMLTYRTGMPELLSGDKQDDVTRLYSPPVRDFQVEALQVPSNQTYVVEPRPGPSLLLIVAGSSATASIVTESAPWTLSKGRVFLIPAKQQVTIDTGDEAITAYRAARSERVK